MAPDNFMQGDPEWTAAQVRADPVTSNGQAGGRQDNEDRRSASNGSGFGDSEEGENPDQQNVQPDHQTSRGQTAGHQTMNQRTSNQQTSYNGAKTSGHPTRERHLFFATGGSPFGEFYRPYENIYGNQDVYGDPLVGEAMHDYNYNHHHPERYPMVRTLPLQRRTALDRKLKWDFHYEQHLGRIQEQGGGRLHATRHVVSVPQGLSGKL
jgi:hypothetical protein